MLNDRSAGELKNPSYAIPRGTITAVIFTFIIYILLCVLVACSCDRLVKGSARRTWRDRLMEIATLPTEVFFGSGR